MATRERILRYLRDHPEGADDDELTKALGLKRRQEANAVCRGLAAQGLLERRQDGPKVRNYPAGTPPLDEDAPPLPPSETPVGVRYDRPWAWEGNVQDAIARHLTLAGWTVHRAADTASKAQGPHIDARMEGAPHLLVTVKGYPPETSRSRGQQARHNFAAALLDLVLWHEEHPGVSLGLGLPDAVAYRRLAEGSSWLFRTMAVTLFWTHGDGSVQELTHSPA